MGKPLAGGEMQQLALSALAAGAYVLKVRSAAHQQTKLLVRE